MDTGNKHLRKLCVKYQQIQIWRQQEILRIYVGGFYGRMSFYISKPT